MIRSMKRECESSHDNICRLRVNKESERQNQGGMKRLKAPITAQNSKGLRIKIKKIIIIIKVKNNNNKIIIIIIIIIII